MVTIEEVAKLAGVSVATVSRVLNNSETVRPATAEKVLNLTRRIVKERKITCLMVTHNMHQALELGNRTLMMDGGHIVLDISGEERARLTVDDLLEQFRLQAGKKLDNDRILLSR